jgi:hypothetical protein
MKQEKHEKLLVPYVSDDNFCEEFEVKIDKLWNQNKRTPE